MTTLTTTQLLYNLPFLLLCASNFFFSASFQMLIPELPDHLTSLGGADYKGYIIALFTLTAGISRPFSGKLTDTVGRVPIMVFGSLVCVLCSAFYPFMTTIFGFLLLRLCHGFSTGFKPTATAAYVADVVSIERRGEAMSAIGISSSIGYSIGPVFGSWITEGFGFTGLCVLSSVSALLSVVILVRNMEETLTERQPFSLKLLKINRFDIFSIAAMPTFIVQFLVSFASGASLTLIPDYSKQIGIANKGLFFAVFTAASLVIRLVASKSSDKYGRVIVLRWATLTTIVSMTILAFFPTYWAFILASIIYGIGWGLSTPTLQAWAVDLVSQENRGRGLATMFIALEAGIGFGAWASQELYRNDPLKMSLPFQVSACMAVLALIYLFFRKK
ncbi:MAG: MFS transporter [Saprospiraceae bacterium]|nr:MFS transporter [Saprospiraceae bacterium]